MDTFKNTSLSTVFPLKFQKHRHRISELEHELETFIVNMYENQLPRVILYLEPFQTESVTAANNTIYYHPDTFTIREHNIASQHIFTPKPRGYEAISLNVGASWIDSDNRTLQPKKPFLEYIRRIPIQDKKFTPVSNENYETHIELYDMNDLKRPSLYLRKLGYTSKRVNDAFRRGARQLVNTQPEKFYYTQPALTQEQE